MEVKRPWNDDGNFSKGNPRGQGQPRFKERLPNQGFSSSTRVKKKDSFPNPKPQGGNSGGSSMTRPTCAK